MKFLEKDLEDILYEASQTEEGRHLLWERGLDISSPLKRQISLGSYGTADLLQVFGGQFITINIIELKRGELRVDDYLQLCRYITAVKRLINFKHSIHRVTGTLIGKGIKLGNDFCYLVNEGGIKVYTYDFDLEKGLTFESQYGWHITGELDVDLEYLTEGISSCYDLDCVIEFQQILKTETD